MKVIFNDGKSGKSYQKEFESNLFSGRKIGDKIEGGVLNLADYEFEITGGSDSAGFPHRKDVSGSVRRKILAGKGVGLKKKVRKGVMIRKSVIGNTFSDKTAQVSLKIVKYGKDGLDKVLGVEKKEAEEKPKEEKKEAKPEVPKEVKKEEPKVEEKKEAKPEAPKEEAKPEVKKEKNGSEI